MKNLLMAAYGALLLLSCQNKAQDIQIDTNKNKTVMEKQNIYQFKVKDLAGNTFDFSTLKGKKILIVNTASKCGLTPQYRDLEVIYKKYKDSNFVVIGFPANNFGSQELGTSAEIASFCQRNYGVSFPMMDKVSVKGSDMCAVYQFLTQKSQNGQEDSEVAWNFQKYLINEKGELEKVISPQILPSDPAVIDWIKE
jgi:glutathione peroxidase